LGKGHGVFFFHVIEALKGKAKNKRGAVTWDNLTSYVRGEVPDDVTKLVGGGAKQTPHLMANVEGDPVLVQADGKVVDSFTNDIGMKLVLIPKGKFQMGSPRGEKDRSDEEEQHEVQITQAFYLGAHEVTQKQFREVMGYNPSYFCTKGDKGDPDVKYLITPGGGKGRVKAGDDTDNYPVENVSWQEAEAFCKKLKDKDKKRPAGHEHRLPTEAEWEYCCRGGASSYQTFHYGDSLSSSQANFDGNSPYGGAKKGVYLYRTCTVGNYKPNGFGLYDMHGNVWEWCLDWYDYAYYGKSPRKDPVNSVQFSARVFRGGGWNYYGQGCRSALRRGYSPGSRSGSLGFRVALVPSGSK
jgi:formylglycine-generating enzyme required for sulfatase activity